MRVLVADGHPIFRRGVVQVLKENNEGLGFDEAATGPEALAAVERRSYDLILLEIAIPDRDGFEVLRQLRGRQPRVPILVVSGYPENPYATRALKLGATGFLSKSSSTDEFVRAAQLVSRGHLYVSPELAELLASSIGPNPTEQPHELLSDREYQVIHQIASGKSLTEIAAHLCLSVKTISTYRTRALQKLNLKSNAELIRHAIQEGLVV